MNQASTTEILNALHGHARPATPISGKPTRIWMATVTTVNPDGTVNCSPIQGRAHKFNVPIPAGYTPTVGDTVLLADLLGDALNPIVITVITAATVNPLSATIPTSSSDGQLWFYNASSTLGATWQFRYNQESSSPHKWESVGSGSVIKGPSGSITTSSASWVALTGGPSFTIPFAGDYDIDFGVQLSQNSGGGSNQLVSLAKNGAQVGEGLNLITAATNAGGPTYGFEPLTGAAAGDVLTLVVENANATTTLFNQGSLRIRPVRVG